MTISKDQAQMLATLACDIRPGGARQWKPDAVMAELAKIQGRSLGAVALATIRAAMDRNAQRPEVISSSGSHWGDTMIASEWVPNAIPDAERCSICSHTATVCRMRFRSDHEFLSAVAARQRAAGVDPERIQAIRATLEPTSPPTERKTLEDMAEANPSLHGRVEALRAANPGLVAPPMRETTHPTTQGDTA